MATMTISIKDEVANELRQTVKNELGSGKGALGKAIEEAVNKYGIYADAFKKKNFRAKKCKQYLERR